MRYARGVRTRSVGDGSCKGAAPVTEMLLDGRRRCPHPGPKIADLVMHLRAVMSDPKPTSSPGRPHGADVPRPRDLRVDAASADRPLARPVLQFDLPREADALRQEQGWSKTGHS